MRFRLGGLVSVLSMAILAAGGCEDGEAQKRDEVQSAVAAARDKLHKAVLAAINPSPEQFESARSALEAVGRELSSISGGDPGQQAARAVLSATAQRELGALNLRHAADLEAQLQSQRNIIAAQAGAIQALQAVSQGYASISATSDREMLGRELLTAQQRLEELSRRMAELDAPIAERTGANSKASQEVETLKLEVGELRTKAEELGYANGLALQEQAIAARRRADKIEYDIAQREMELGYDLKAEHDLAGEQAGFAQNRITTIESSQGQLDEFMKETSADIATMRSATDELAGQIASSLKQVNDAMSGELAPLYEQAQTALDKAAAQAQQAASQGKGDEVGAAKLLRAQILETQGRLNWNRARGLTDHLTTLQTLSVALEGAQGLQGIASEVQSTEAAHKQAVEQATNAYSEAQQALDQVTVRGDQAALEQFKSEIAKSVALLTGKPVEPAATPDESPTADASSGAPTPGVASAESFLQNLKTLIAEEKNLTSLAERLSDMTVANTDDGKKAVALSRQAGGVMQAFAETMEAKFGKEAAAGVMKGFPMGAGMNAIAGATITEQTADRAKISYPMPGGMTKDSWLVKVNDSWLIDGDALDASDKAQLAMGPQVLSIFQGLTERMRSGDIATPEALMQEFMNEMAKLGAAAGGAVPPPGGS